VGRIGKGMKSSKEMNDFYFTSYERELFKSDFHHRSSMACARAILARTILKIKLEKPP